MARPSQAQVAAQLSCLTRQRPCLRHLRGLDRTQDWCYKAAVFSDRSLLQIAPGIRLIYLRTAPVARLTGWVFFAHSCLGVPSLAIETVQIKSHKV
jgi:hypothetical protein